jgi:hypothetical protein
MTETLKFNSPTFYLQKEYKFMAVCRTEFRTFFELYEDVRVQYVTCYNQIDHKTLTISEHTELTLNSTPPVPSVALLYTALLPTGLQLGPVHNSRYSYTPDTEATVM